MTTSVVICDDSVVARKQIARALPEDWDVDITFAAGAREAIDAVRGGKGEVLFLDLTMPGMDGYQTLKYLSSVGLTPSVIVISGDVQEAARRRSLELGAKAFLTKPVDRAELRSVLQTLGLLDTDTAAASVRTRTLEPAAAIDTHDALQEVVNVAVGQASALLASLFDTFVSMPIPRVVRLEPGDLRMMLAGANPGATVSSICQGFIGSGIAGEALIRFNDASFGDLGRLMKFEGEIDRASELELLMDLANVLVGACLKGVADQFDIRFSLGHPAIVGQHAVVANLFADHRFHWNNTLAVELAYRVEDYQLSSEVLLVFTEKSMPPLKRRLEYVFS